MTNRRPVALVGLTIPIDINLDGALEAVSRRVGGPVRASDWAQLHRVCRVLGIGLLPGKRTVTDAGEGYRVPDAMATHRADPTLMGEVAELLK